MKNGLTALNDYLFEQIERINDDDLDEKGLNLAIAKAETITKISETIIKNGELALKTAAVVSRLGKNSNLPPLLVGTQDNSGENNEKE